MLAIYYTESTIDQNNTFAPHDRLQFSTLIPTEESYDADFARYGIVTASSVTR